MRDMPRCCVCGRAQEGETGWYRFDGKDWCPAHPPVGQQETLFG